jgi:LysR family transcriptional regulator of gallate degradation
MLKLRNLRAVINVTGSGSVSQAARNLNLSQPAVTHAVKRIESQLEITTFDRCHNGMETTKIGKVVTGCIKLALQQIELAKTEIKGLINHSLMRRKSEFSIQGIIKYSHLLILVEVSNYKSIPYAALKIGVTEPVVYRSIRELEDITSTNLFHRGTNFTTSIISGILVRKAKLIFAELRHMHDEIHQYNGRMAGEVIIGTQTSSRTILVPRAIAQLSEQYPNLHFSMID